MADEEFYRSSEGRYFLQELLKCTINLSALGPLSYLGVEQPIIFVYIVAVCMSVYMYLNEMKTQDSSVVPEPIATLFSIKWLPLVALLCSIALKNKITGIMSVIMMVLIFIINVGQWNDFHRLNNINKYPDETLTLKLF